MNEVHLLEQLRGKQNIIQLYNWEMNPVKKVCSWWHSII